jgi:hypothetical protein
VLLIWDATIHDLKTLGGKFFYKKLCSGDINHIAIRQLQVILLKVALLLGVQIFTGVAYKQSLPGHVFWTADVEPKIEELTKYEYNVLIGADGEHSTLVPEFSFNVKTLQHGTSIGVTANFVNQHTQEELNLKEFSLIRYANLEMFEQLQHMHDLEMENLVRKDMERLRLYWRFNANSVVDDPRSNIQYNLA